MLTDAQMNEALDVFRKRTQKVTDEYLKKMGEHIRDIGQLTPSDVHRLQQIRRMNRNLEDVKRQIVQLAGTSTKDLERALNEAARVDSRVTQKILGVSDASVQLQNNVALQRALRAQLAETEGTLRNLSKSTVVSTAYKDAVDAAVSVVQSGAEDYNSAIRSHMRQAGAMGLRIRENGTKAVEYASGHTRRLDSAVKMNVLDAMRRMNQQAMNEVGREFGANGVEIDAHMLCAEDHLPYQGQQYSNEEFEQIQDSLPRPFGEWNCRHTWSPIILGISNPAYSPEQLEAMERYSTEEITIDGRTKTRYEWSQEMRRCETAIRAKKDTANLAAASGDSTLKKECQRSVVELNRYYEQLADKAGLEPDFRRTYVARAGQQEPVQVAAPVKYNNTATAPESELSGLSDAQKIEQVMQMADMPKDQAERVAEILWGYNGNESYCYSDGADSDIRARKDEKTSEWADVLQNFVDRSPKYDGPIYRGMAVSDEILARFVPGAKFDEQKYALSSWSSEEGVARRFANRTERRSGGTMAIFECRSTTHGTSITHLALYDTEHEVLVNNDGVSYMVVSREKITLDHYTSGAKDFIRIVLEEVR